MLETPHTSRVTKQNQERRRRMLQLRFVEGWTLQEIGVKFGMTRQRVAQIVGRSGGGRYPKVGQA